MTTSSFIVSEALEGLLLIFMSAVFGLFIVAGVSKIRALDDFRSTIIRMPFVPRVLISFIVYAIPVVEIVTGITGLAGAYFPASVAGCIILASFIGMTIVMIRKKLEVPCNCFGESGEIFGSKILIRNSVMLIPLAIYALNGRNLEFNYAITIAGCSAAFTFLALTQVLTIGKNQNFKIIPTR